MGRDSMDGRRGVAVGGQHGWGGVGWGRGGSSHHLCSSSHFSWLSTGLIRVCRGGVGLGEGGGEGVFGAGWGGSLPSPVQFVPLLTALHRTDQQVV